MIGLPELIVLLFLAGIIGGIILVAVIVKRSNRKSDTKKDAR